MNGMIINRKELIFILLFLCFHISFGQESTIDSLKNQLNSASEDTRKVQLLNDLFLEILGTEDIDGSLIYAKQALELATTIGDLKGKAYALKHIGLAEYYRSNYSEVLSNWTQSLETFEIAKDTLGIANMASNLGGDLL
jgi:hypothetical protein